MQLVILFSRGSKHVPPKWPPVLRLSTVALARASSSTSRTGLSSRACLALACLELSQCTSGAKWFARPQPVSTASAECGSAAKAVPSFLVGNSVLHYSGDLFRNCCRPVGDALTLSPFVVNAHCVPWVALCLPSSEPKSVLPAAGNPNCSSAKHLCLQPCLACFGASCLTGHCFHPCMACLPPPGAL